MRKGFAQILMLGLVVAVLVLGGAYYLKKIQKPQPASSSYFPTPSIKPSTSPSSKPESATSADTSKWKTYTNTEYGFSLKYPNGWTTREDLSYVKSDYIIWFNAPDKPNGAMLVSVYDNKDGKYSIDTIHSDNSDKNISNHRIPITIDGIEGKRDREVPGLCGYDSVFVNKNAKIYEISLFCGDTNNKYLSIFDQSLSTFKFTN